MLIATAYYPEHWPRERWDVDARMMRDAGIDRVRMGEFAWKRFEPSDGVFAFDWMREAIDLFAAHGIATIMCTPTACYPVWLRDKFPDLHQQRRNGGAKHWGMRQDVEKCHPGYRQHARRIVEAVAGAFGQHGAVVAWQIDNEIGCHGTARSYSRYAEREFHAWLRRRHGSIDALNRAWGTAFWSQEYDAFEQVPVPRETTDGQWIDNETHNPGLALDFDRFSSDVQIAFAREQADVLRRLSPGRIITHNLMGWFNEIDYHRLADELDVVGFDAYPHFSTRGRAVINGGFDLALTRGTRGKPFWILEQTAGAGSWGVIPPQPIPGQLRLWAWQSIAHGADLLGFFNWRSCRWGREQYWHGILDHHGQPGRRLAEISAFAAELHRLADRLDGSEVQASVALIFDYETRWALETQRNVSQGFDLWSLSERWQRGLRGLGIACDAVRPLADLARYDLVIAPCLHVVSDEVAAHLSVYVDGGGTFVMGPRSGVKDPDNAVVDALLPGPLRALAGCSVEEYDTFGDVPGYAGMTVRGRDGSAISAHVIADVLSPDAGAETLLTYGDRHYAGRAAAVARPLGRGCGVYLGTVLDDAGCGWFAGRLLPSGRASPVPADTEVMRRRRGKNVYAFHLNHAGHPVTFANVRAGTDLLSGDPVDGNLTLPAFGVAIIAER